MFRLFRPIEKVKVIDVLQDWRQTKIGNFNVFDKVMKKVYYGNEALNQVYVLIYLGDSTNSAMCMKKDGSFDYIDLDNLKLYYGEFQEEFEALNQSQSKILEVERLGKELLQAQQDAEELYQKGKRVVEERVNQQFIL